MLSAAKNIWIAVLVYGSIVVGFLVNNWNVIIDGNRDTTSNHSLSTEYANPEDVTLGNKVILFWNAFFYDEDFRFGFGREPFVKYGCPVSRCETTSDKRVMREADAILIHTPLVENMPSRPRVHQTYVMVQVEPHMSNSDILLPAMTGYFNLTMTYRQDSDIVIHYAHRKRNIAFAELVDVDPGDRPKSVVWVVSHCETPSRRELYAEELKRFIDVDVYGDCGSLRCPKKNNTYCRAMYERTYRFYLSFENDICADYVSEKLYHPLRYKIVPIVYGGADYDNVAPPHSVINIVDFPNPKDLADYLRYLARNRTAYNEYFKWKRTGTWFDLNPRQRIADGMCRLCDILHDKNYEYRDYTNIRNWWVDGSCNQTAMDNMISNWKHRS
ncbi:hypothetical protein LSH36_167g04049 [Paralvinella palmiformis]|uniref:Fucosyltransferase n=1 Tax=Paralvinella palmiformis TaxID=53620 RepID=A0AAD9JTC6_9ANNE|nr:hypothetical protein LSH36_167g04049 [Paralvinella palmiformis]